MRSASFLSSIMATLAGKSPKLAAVLINYPLKTSNFGADQKFSVFFISIFLKQNSLGSSIIPTGINHAVSQGCISPIFVEIYGK